MSGWEYEVWVRSSFGIDVPHERTDDLDYVREIVEQAAERRPYVKRRPVGEWESFDD